MGDEIRSHGYNGQLDLRFFNLMVERSGPDAAYFYIPVHENAYVQRAQWDILNGLPQGVTLEAQDENLLHITLLFIEKMRDEFIPEFFERLNIILPVDFEVEVVSVGTFPEAESKPIVLHVAPDPALLRLQSELYNVAVSMGLEISEHSDPARYKPHITLAYELDPPDVEIPKLAEPFKVLVDRFYVTRDEYKKSYTVYLPTFDKDVGEGVERGGPGSGHHGHAGRPGHIGGSEPEGMVVSDPGKPLWTGKKMFDYQNEKIESLPKRMGKTVPQGMDYRPGRWLGLHSEGVGDVWRELALRNDEDRVDWYYIDEKLYRLEKDLDRESDRALLIEGPLSADDEAIRQEMISLWSTLPFSMPNQLQVARDLNLAVLKRDESEIRRLVAEIRLYEPKEAVVVEERGGPGSGHYEHAGRPGDVGGSAPSGTKSPDKVGGRVSEDAPVYEKVRLTKTKLNALKHHATHGYTGKAEEYFLGVEGYVDEEAIKDKPYIYISSFRPLGSWAKFPEGVFYNDRMVWSEKPLPLDTIYDLELGAVNNKSQGHLWKELYENQNEPAVGDEHRVWTFTRQTEDNYKGFVVHPSTDADEKPWRASYYDLKGFSGHSYYDSPEDAIANEVGDNSWSIRPSLFESISKKDSFNIGNARTMLRQQLRSEGVPFDEIMTEVNEKYPWPEGTPGVTRSEPEIGDEKDLNALTENLLDMLFGPKIVGKYAISRGTLLQLIRGEPVFLGQMKRVVTLADGPFSVFEDGDEVIQRVSAPEPIEFIPQVEPVPEPEISFFEKTVTNIQGYLDGTISFHVPGQTIRAVEPGRRVTDLRERIADVLRNFTEGFMKIVERGGAGSGHHDHEGRPGEVGGSLPSGASGADQAEGGRVSEDDPVYAEEKLTAAKEEAGKAGKEFENRLERFIDIANNKQLEMTDTDSDEDFNEFEQSLREGGWDLAASNILLGGVNNIRELAGLGGDDYEMFAQDELQSRISSMIEDDDYEIQQLLEDWYNEQQSWDDVRQALDLTPDQFVEMSDGEIHGNVLQQIAVDYIDQSVSHQGMRETIDEDIYPPMAGLESETDVSARINEFLWSYYEQSEAPASSSELYEMYGGGGIGEGAGFAEAVGDDNHLWYGRSDSGEIVVGMYAKELQLENYVQANIRSNIAGGEPGFQGIEDSDIDAKYLYIDLLGSKRKGEGYGTEIMLNAMTYAAENNMGILGNPTDSAWSFYTSMGAKRIGSKGFFTPTDVKHAMTALEIFGVEEDALEAVSKTENMDFDLNQGMQIWNVIDMEDPAALMYRPSPQSVRDNMLSRTSKIISKADARLGRRPEPKEIATVKGTMRRIGVEKHYGPGDHPGTGTPQSVHAGGRGGKRSVGLTSARPGRLSSQVFQDMGEFADKLAEIQGVKDASVKPGMGGWEGGSEPTWIIEFSGNGEALKLIAETAKRFDQDGVLILDDCKGAANCSPVVDWTFEERKNPDQRKHIESLLVKHGIGGWTWSKDEGKPSLRAVSVPQWGGEAGVHLSAADALSKVFSSEGIGFDFETDEVLVTVMNREGANSYDEYISR